MLKTVFKKTRIAPTPSGFLHLGNAYSFSLTAALAKKTKARILLRIDNLDRERTDNKYVQDIFDTLSYLNIEWEEGPKNINEYDKMYSQMHRLTKYNKVLTQLAEGGKVYACCCSRSQLAKNSDFCHCREKNISLSAENVSWRLDTSATKELHVSSLSGETLKATLPLVMKDFIVRKKDGFPAYQLTSLVDDLYFEIDLIVRGEDLWDSTLAQLYLADVLCEYKFAHITFYHHTLIKGEENLKLSKSAGDTSVRHFRQQKVVPGDVYACIKSMLQINAPLTKWEDFIALLRH